MEVKKRDDSLDIAAGFFIVYMILYHCMQWGGLRNSPVYMYMEYLGFFMPWFFFKGGMFFKPKENLATFKGSFKRLIVPFFVWSLIGHFVFCCCEYLSGTRDVYVYLLGPAKQMLRSGAISGNLPLWFLTTLFAVRMVLNVGCNWKIPVWAISMFGLAGAFAAYCLEIKQPLWIANVGSGVFFFGLGSYWNKLKKKNLVIVAATLIFIFVSVFFRPYVDMRENSLLKGDYLVWPIWSLSGVVLVNFLFFQISRLRINPLRFLAPLGKESMSYYVAHWPVILLANLIFGNFGGHETDTLHFSVIVLFELMMSLCIFLILSYRRWSTASS